MLQCSRLHLRRGGSNDSRLPLQLLLAPERPVSQRMLGCDALVCKRIPNSTQSSSSTVASSDRQLPGIFCIIPEPFTPRPDSRFRLRASSNKRIWLGNPCPHLQYIASPSPMGKVFQTNLSIETSVNSTNRRGKSPSFGTPYPSKYIVAISLAPLFSLHRTVPFYHQSERMILRLIRADPSFPPDDRPEPNLNPSYGTLTGSRAATTDSLVLEYRKGRH